jgi:hypothetical protein
MTDGQHREAVKTHLDELICLQTAIDEQRDSIQEGMMKRYDQQFQEVKGIAVAQTTRSSKESTFGTYDPVVSMNARLNDCY